MCPAVWVGSAQAEVQRRRLSWCCARKAATHHPPSVPSHGLKQYFFLQRADACKSCRCKKATGQETKRCKLCHYKNLFGGQTGKASYILVEHANRKE